MTLPDDWICPSRERCLCGSICEAREAMDPPEPVLFPGEAYAEEADDADRTPTGGLREELVRLRQEQRISQAELAQRIGVTQTAVSYWETGQRQPGLDDVERWAAALGASPSLLQGPPFSGGSELRDRIDAALRTVGLARNLAAYRDAVLPVVEAALAQQAAEIDEDIIKPERALHEQTIQRAEQAERERDEARLVAASLADNGPEHLATIERAEQAERQRDAALAALRDLTDGRPCAPHPGNGWCQTHGERAPCPHAAAKKLLAAVQPEHGEEQAAPVDWEATVRQRERELKRVGEARHQAEAAVQRVRDLAEAAKRDTAQLFARQFGGAPFPATLRADDVLAALDQPEET